MDESRRAVLKTLAALGVGSLTGLAVHGHAYARNGLEVTRTDLALAGLPPELDGFRLTLLTDLHRSETVPRRTIDAAVDAVLAAQSELVVLGGDYVTWGNRSFVDDAADALGRLTAAHGVVAVLGNHDDDRDTPRALGRHGITVLRDERTSVVVRGVGLELVGVRYWTRKPSTIAEVLKGATGFPILLAHDPRRLDTAAELGFRLALSGHTHGGQVVVPGIGPLAARKFPVVAGVGRRGPTTMYVSRGVGTVYLPFRINCPPEVCVITLRGSGPGIGNSRKADGPTTQG